MVYYIYVIHKCTVGLETCMPYGQLVDSQLSLCAVHESMSQNYQDLQQYLSQTAILTTHLVRPK